MVMAGGTLFVLDASLPGGFVEGTGEIRHAQTLARLRRSMLDALQRLQRAVGRTERLSRALLQPLAVGRGRVVPCAGAVIYIPFLQRAFSTWRWRAS